MTKDQKVIEELLARRIGLDPISTGPHVILAAARRRMADLGVADLGEYAARAAGSEAEQQALIEEVVVPESWFFRDERPFRRLADHARERWIADRRRPPLRILSIPCAGGQEPYSIAITLLDAGLPAGRFHIDGVDVSGRVLEAARRGMYSANAFRHGVGWVRPADLRPRDPMGPAPPTGPPLNGRWERHFRRHPHGYEIDPAIRSTVRFLRGNILDQALLADSPPYDVVFCRNLLIYLDRSARSSVLAALDRLLVDDGMLFIGHADRLDVPDVPARFATAGEPGCFAYRKAAPAARPDESRTEPAPAPTVTMTMLMLPEPEPLRMLPIPGPAAATPEPVSPPPPSPSALEQAAELANRGRYGEAIAACERHLRLKGPGAPAYYLMGMIHQAAGDRRRAEECFHKTIYLDPRHDEALLALTLLAERRGDREAAAGFRRRARRAGLKTVDSGQWTVDSEDQDPTKTVASGQ
jgi:chemotaxis protein methyltransferase WspC